jgi:hypothetical protein
MNLIQTMKIFQGVPSMKREGDQRMRNEELGMRNDGMQYGHIAIIDISFSVPHYSFLIPHLKQGVSPCFT